MQTLKLGNVVVRQSYPGELDSTTSGFGPPGYDKGASGLFIGHKLRRSGEIILSDDEWIDYQNTPLFAFGYKHAPDLITFAQDEIATHQAELNGFGNLKHYSAYPLQLESRNEIIDYWDSFIRWETFLTNLQSR